MFFCIVRHHLSPFCLTKWLTWNLTVHLEVERVWVGNNLRHSLKVLRVWRKRKVTRRCARRQTKVREGSGGLWFSLRLCIPAVRLISQLIGQLLSQLIQPRLKLWPPAPRGVILVRLWLCSWFQPNMPRRSWNKV